MPEGSVGGGTGMICHEFKCGTGTASRVVQVAKRPYVIGVLVQANYGRRNTLRIAGAPVGRELQQHRIYTGISPDQGDTGSIIAVVATDAPLLPTQLKRLSRARLAQGLGRNGSLCRQRLRRHFRRVLDRECGRHAGRRAQLGQASSATTCWTRWFFWRRSRATEEAIIEVNAMVAAHDRTGQ